MQLHKHYLQATGILQGKTAQHLNLQCHQAAWRCCRYPVFINMLTLQWETDLFFLTWRCIWQFEEGCKNLEYLRYLRGNTSVCDASCGLRCLRYISARPLSLKPPCLIVVWLFRRVPTMHLNNSERTGVNLLRSVCVCGRRAQYR